MKKKITLLLALSLIASSAALTSCEMPGALDDQKDQITEDTENTENTENTDETNTENTASSDVKLTDADKVNVMNIGGVDVSLAQYRLFLLTRASSYGDAAFDEENLKAIDGEVLNDVKEYASYSIKANADGITLSDEYKAAADQQLDQVRQAFGDEYESQLAEYFFTEKSYYDIVLAQFLANQTIEEAVAKSSISDDDVLSFVKDNYVRVKHILLMTQGKDEAEKAEILERAENVLDRARSGESFEDLVTEFSEDGMDVDSGYYFTYGTMVKEFEDTSYALEEGEISGLVESSYGYHIIKKYPMEDAYILDAANGILNEVKYSIETSNYQAALLELLGSAEVTYYDNYEECRADILDEYKAMISTDAEGSADAE